MKTLQKLAIAAAILFLGMEAQAMRWYSPSTGRWLSRDPIDENGGLNLYCLLSNDPVNDIDLLGLSSPNLSYSTVEKKAGDCGNFLWHTKWKLKGLVFKKRSKVGGAIVQHYTWTIDIQDKEGNRVGPATPLPRWEAWTVNPGQSVTTIIENGGTYDDDWSVGASFIGTKGTITITADAGFYEGQSIPSVFTVDPSSPSGILPSTSTDPGLAGASASISRSLEATWDCLCKTEKTKLKTK